MDTVEWGSVEPTRRRIPRLRYRLPRVGALTLCLLGFGAFVAAELVPWGTVHVPSSGDVVRGIRGPFADGHGLVLNQLPTNNLLTYHLAVIALLGVVGLVVAGGGTRRRAAMGAALGLAGGVGITIMATYYSVTHYFDSFYFGDFGSPEPAGLPEIGGGPGVFLAVAGLALLVAGVLTAGLGLRGGHPTPPASVAAPVNPASRKPEDDRELTVSSLEPYDEAYFARPDTR